MRRILLAILLLATSAYADVYSSAVLQDAPVDYWRLNETSGTSVTDIGSSPITGTYTGSPTLNQTALPGANRGASVTFGSSGMYADFPSGTNAPLNPNVTNLAGWSAEIWANFVNLTATHFIIGRYKGASNYSWQIFTDNTPNAFFNVYKVCAGNTGANTITTLAHVTSTPMYHMVVTTVGNGTNIDAVFYLNGVSQGTLSNVPICTSNTNSLRIATDGDGSFNPNDRLAEVAIYSTQLSAARVLAHYNTGINPQNLGLWPWVVKRPELPRFRDDGYMERLVSLGYGSGQIAPVVAQPQYLTVGYLPFQVVPSGRLPIQRRMIVP